ncbi:MAG: response regulator [Chloroflexota bacterium]|nr:MAG: response regulator [Chloroflexota bacterium]
MRKIMVIDDDLNVADIVRQALGSVGYKVAAVTSTSSVMKRVLEENPSLILLDLMMPSLDGWQVLELLQSHPRTAHIPIVILTAAVHSLPDIQSYYGGAIRDYVTKPFDIDDLIAKVNGALRDPTGGGEIGLAADL